MNFTVNVINSVIWSNLNPNFLQADWLQKDKTGTEFRYIPFKSKLKLGGLILI